MIKKTCWDGSKVFPGVPCPPSRAGGGKIKCPDGTEVERGTRCPVTPTPSSRPGGGKITCPNGVKVQTGTKCPDAVKKCANGFSVAAGKKCPRIITPDSNSAPKPVVLSAVVLGSFVLAFLIVSIIFASNLPSSTEQKLTFWFIFAALLTSIAALGCSSVTWNDLYT